MSKVNDDTMVKHFDYANTLKAEFLKTGNTELIEKMRKVHGCAIFDNFLLKKTLSENYSSRLPDDYAILLSNNESLLHVIHCHIRFCEKKAYPHNDNTSASLDYNTRTPSVNTTEYLDNLQTTEANRILSRLSEQYPILSPITSLNGMSDIMSESVSNYDVRRPTLVNYTGLKWCPMSQQFQPVWQQFKTTANQRYPGLQIAELDVAKDDTELYKLANKVGVNGFPTIVLFYNDHIYRQEGSTDLQHIYTFLDKHLH